MATSDEQRQQNILSCIDYEQIVEFVIGDNSGFPKVWKQKLVAGLIQ